MSEHSKFADVKHKKKRNDAAKGRIFTVIGREITAAVKEGGVDPANNSKLRGAIAKTKANGMPNDTIDRGTEKATGNAGSVDYKALIYEGYGPSGVAIIVNTLTDNKNRTAANVRSAFAKGGGDIGTPGSVSYVFDKRRQIIIDKEECGMDPDELMMLALDTEVEDFSEGENSYKVVMAPEDFSTAHEVLEARNIPMMQADVTMIPQAWVELTDEDDIRKLNHTLGLLDEDDGAQVVYRN